MSSTISRLKSTDSLAQWASKTNQIIDTVEGFISTGGSFTSSSPTVNDLLVYDTVWKNKTLIAGDVTIDGTYSSSTQFKFALTTTAFTSKTVASSITPSSDLLLIYSGGAVKAVTPATISTPGGSTTYVQYNNSGTFAGTSGFTFSAGVLSVPTGLNINSNNLYVGSSKVGVGTGSPSVALDVVGNINATGSYSISGTSVLSSTTLGSGIVNSSLTSVGTLTSLNVSGAASVTGVLTGRTNVVSQSTTGSVSVQATYIVGANSITLTLPGSPTAGDRIGFRSASSSINSYTVARNGNNIMGLSSDLTVDVAAAFDLLYTGSGWVLS